MFTGTDTAQNLSQLLQSLASVSTFVLGIFASLFVSVSQSEVAGLEDKWFETKTYNIDDPAGDLAAYCTIGMIITGFIVVQAMLTTFSLEIFSIPAGRKDLLQIWLNQYIEGVASIPKDAYIKS